MEMLLLIVVLVQFTSVQLQLLHFLISSFYQIFGLFGQTEWVCETSVSPYYHLIVSSFHQPIEFDEILCLQNLPAVRSTNIVVEKIF